MQCEQARQLFDAYLDGELSPAMATELGAHRVRCADCRQALALLEVSGHILRSDREPVQPPDDFTDRLLACVDTSPKWHRRILHGLYIGGPLAAAAVIAMAFLGVFDGKRPSQVAGVQEIAPAAHVQPAPVPKTKSATPMPKVDPAEQALGEYIDRSKNSMKDKGESVQRVLDLTVLQMLDILEEAKTRAKPGGKQESGSFSPPTKSHAEDESDGIAPQEEATTDDDAVDSARPQEP